MPSIAPSYLTKLDRTGYHLADLRAAIERFGGTDRQTRPYTVRKSSEGRREVHRLHFRRSVMNTDIPLITADAIYNMRSSLDHLMSALVPPKKRGGAIFPIYFRGVADAAAEGENEQRTKERERWLSDTRSVATDAVEFLKRLQPPDEPTHDESPHSLRLLNQLSNKDRHTRLPVVANGVEGLIISWRMPDGDIRQTLGRPDADHLIEAEATLSNVPRAAVYLECYGPVHVVVARH